VSTKSTGSAWKSTTSIFIAGVLSTLIVSPCVSAPLAGALLYISSQGDAWYGAMMLFVMALGMGVPLLLVGLFGPKILPKSGEWLQDIKVLMGFGLLAMAIWLITRWLPISSHLYLWSVLALAVSSYFLHRAYKVASHPIRWFCALAFFLIGSVEFIGGAIGSSSPLQPLKRLSSPSTTLEEQVIFDATITNLDELNAIIANQDSRPIMLDLYADWCISCKILEDMFASSDVLPLLNKVQLIRVDVTENSVKNQALMQKFNLFGPPSLIFLDNKGEERKTLTLMGEPSKSTLIDRLNRAIEQ
jgi:thiol:disulfide interchange protein DsbD